MLFGVAVVQRAFFEKIADNNPDIPLLISVQIAFLIFALLSLNVYREIEQAYLRFIALFLLCLTISTVGFFIAGQGTDKFTLVRVALAFTIGFTIAERMEMLRHRSQELKKLFVEKEQIERALLTQQLNPHFLFNTLNTLKGLIEENQQNAVNYLHDFAKVYRSIVNIKSDELFRLDEELKLLSSYYKLLKSRFGDKLVLEVEVDQRELTKYLPPLSLQLLFENAIKHNEVSATRPLTVRIASVGSTLVITNPIQEKVSFDASNGLGLSNLNLRYVYAIGVEISYSITDKNEFQVTLPLVENDKENV
jgi:LytS/YehU family sensor histidine kinase